MLMPPEPPIVSVTKHKPSPTIKKVRLKKKYMMTILFMTIILLWLTRKSNPRCNI